MTGPVPLWLELAYGLVALGFVPGLPLLVWWMHKDRQRFIAMREDEHDETR
jgi:uncharacterized Tic20 family protein